MTKTEQILETVRALREAKLKANVVDFRMRLPDTNISDYINLAANKMDQLCEVLQLCVTELEKISSGTTNRLDGDIATDALTKAASILANQGSDKGAVT